MEIHTTGLVTLPQEICDAIRPHLPTKAIKNLRLTSSKCCAAFPLHFRRVFLSANSCNIRVMREIASHPVYRLQVEELVWDDAQLARCPDKRDRFALAGAHGDSDADEDSDEDFDYSYFPYNEKSAPDNQNDDVVELPSDDSRPSWFRRLCKLSERMLKASPGLDGPTPYHMRKRDRWQAAWDLDTCWTYYQNLLADESQVMDSGADKAAMRYALTAFPSLTKITLTPAAHGLLFTPIYETPMIRSLPDQLIYPIPRGWPYFNRFSTQDMPDVIPWNDNTDIGVFRIPGAAAGEKNRSLWRGYSLVLDCLATTDHNIREFDIDSHGVETGINCYAVCHDCPERDNFIKLCSRDGFRKLHLELYVNGIECYDYAPLQDNRLRSALSAAADLEYFHFGTSMDMDVSGRLYRLHADSEDMDHDFVSLSSLLPVDRWSNLRFFGLSQFAVWIPDLVDFLGKLPLAVQNVELSCLMFLQSGTFRGLLEQMKDELLWAHRTPEQRPALTMSVSIDRNRAFTWHRVILKNTVNDFLYRDGPNPFCDETDPEGDGNTVRRGQGDLQWDCYEPELARLYDDYATQRPNQFGYIDWNGDESRFFS